MSNMNYYSRLFILLLCVICVGIVSAQDVATVPYVCGFEDAEENEKWVLNAGDDGENCLDQWRIDNLESNEGFQSLYISCDTGRTSNHGYEQSTVVVYRKLKFPKGSYDISLDWKCRGEEYKTGLRAFIVPEADEKLLQSSSTKSYTSAQLSRYYVPFKNVVTGEETAMLYGNRNWSNISIEYMFAEERTVCLAFVWQNSFIDSVVDPQAACIDNIQITKTTCRKPWNIDYYSACDTIDLQWEGASEMYEVEWRRKGSKRWFKQTEITTKSFLITNITEGAYDVRVRGICGNDTSAYTCVMDIICFCPDNHCINYVDLDREGVECQVGLAGDPTKTSGIGTSNTGWGTTGAGPIDYGPNQIISRHTVYWKMNEYDPRTGNGLATIPEGEMASVRIGNWQNGGEAERIIYDYYVDPNSTAILLLKYAMVLQAPGHGPKDDSFFSLEIIDENGTLLGTGECGKAEFTPENREIPWHEQPDPSGDDFMKVRWKDWSSVGIDLRPYRGMNIKIRLTVQDCTFQGHYGYAYFTLGCVEATIKNRSCGADTDMKMEAPEGFNYEWFVEDDPENILSTEKEFTILADDIKTYVCRVKYLDKEGCDFELKTDIVPRLPKAEFNWEWKPRECKNIVHLNNTSYVETMVDGVPTRTLERCETQKWTISDGKTVVASENANYTLTVPNEGGTYTVSLLTGIANNACEDDTTITFTVPSIYSHKVEFEEMGCYGKAVGFGTGNNFKYLTKKGVYVDSTYNCWGCDSVNIMTLDFRDKIEPTEMYDTICFGETYEIHGFSYSEPGSYKMRLKTQDKYECDSIVTLHLTELPEITFDLDHKDVFDVPHSGEIYINNLSLDTLISYKVDGNANAPLTGLDAGEYEVVVCNDYGCCSEPKKVKIDAICLEVILSDDAQACADDKDFTFTYELGEGTPTTYTVKFSDDAKSEGFVDFTDSISAGTKTAEITISIPENVRPDYYAAQVVFEDIICEDIILDVHFLIEYSSGIIVQKFDNLLTLFDEENNGGYEFVSYQWYRNDELIPGAIDSYYYLGDDEKFSPEDAYRVELVRKGEDFWISTCSMFPDASVGIDDIEDANALVVVNKNGLLQVLNLPSAEDFEVQVYSPVGQYLYRLEIDADGYLSMPLPSGVYMLHFVSQKSTYLTKIIL